MAPRHHREARGVALREALQVLLVGGIANAVDVARPRGQRLDRVGLDQRQRHQKTPVVDGDLAHLVGHRHGAPTQVGELGGRLSEGEKQRIGLARMFLRDADLVLFDEPTSRLDAYNESVILGSINDLAERGSAVVLVSHRDSTMRIADRILRM